MIIALVVIMSIAGSSLLGQATDNAQINAIVKAALSVALDNNVEFGNISATSSPYVDPTGAADVDAGATAAAGEFTITGQSAADVNITLGAATTNLGDGTSALMEFTADLKENVTTQGSAIAISNPVTLGGATHKLWLGGTLRQVGGAALSSQTAGTYASDAANGGGNIVVNVIYN